MTYAVVTVLVIMILVGFYVRWRENFKEESRRLWEGYYKKEGSKMNEDKNVACPFCGEEEALEINHELKALECGGCGAIAPPSMFEPEDLDLYFEDIERRWEIRPIEDQLRTEVEELKIRIKHLDSVLDHIHEASKPLGLLKRVE